MMDEDDATSGSIDRALSQDPRRGRAAIDILLPRLTPWELLYLRVKARSFPIEATNANGFATCAELPATILTLISSQLNFNDLLRLRLVCKEWKVLWMQHEVLRHVFRQHFPDMLMLNPDVGDLEPLFLRTVSMRRLKTPEDLCFRFVSWSDSEGVPHGSTQDQSDAQPTSQLSDTDRLHLDENGGRDLHNHIYTKGKVAWQQTNDEFVVDHLHTGQRNRYMVDEDRRKGREPKRLVAASSNLLVIAVFPVHNQDSQRSRQLRIYHDKHLQWKRVSLPAPFSKCFASSNTIVATCLSGQAFVWSWDDGLAELPTNDPAQHEPDPSKLLLDRMPRVLLSAKCRNVVFLVWVYTHDSRSGTSIKGKSASDHLYTIVIIKYERSASCSWSPVQRFSHAVPYPELPEEVARKFENYGEASSVDYIPQCRKVNSYGAFQVGVYRNLLRFTAAHRRERDELGDIWHPPASVIQCFNVFTGNFFVAKYEETAVLMPPKAEYRRYPEAWCRIQLWNRQLLRFQNQAEWNINNWRETDYYGEQDSLSISLQYVRRGVEWSEDQQWPLVLNTPKLGPTILSTPRKFFVDDDFIVVFTAFGYLKLVLRSNEMDASGTRPIVAST